MRLCDNNVKLRGDGVNWLGQGSLMVTDHGGESMQVVFASAGKLFMTAVKDNRVVETKLLIESKKTIRCFAIKKGYLAVGYPESVEFFSVTRDSCTLLKSSGEKFTGLQEISWDSRKMLLAIRVPAKGVYLMDFHDLEKDIFVHETNSHEVATAMAWCENFLFVGDSTGTLVRYNIEDCSKRSKKCGSSSITSLMCSSEKGLVFGTCRSQIRVEQSVSCAVKSTSSLQSFGIQDALFGIGMAQEELIVEAREPEPVIIKGGGSSVMSGLFNIQLPEEQADVIINGGNQPRCESSGTLFQVESTMDGIVENVEQEGKEMLSISLGYMATYAKHCVQFGRLDEWDQARKIKIEEKAKVRGLCMIKNKSTPRLAVLLEKPLDQNDDEHPGFFFGSKKNVALDLFLVDEVRQESSKKPTWVKEILDAVSNVGIKLSSRLDELEARISRIEKVVVK